MASLLRCIRALLLLALAGAPVLSHAAYWDGYSLQELMAADDRAKNGTATSSDYTDAGKLTAYTLGVHDALSGILICTAEGVKVGQIVAIVKKYVQEHPEQWNMPADVLIQSALSPVFPCKKK